MSIGTLPTRTLRKLSPQSLASLALEADQERRRATLRGDHDAAREWDAETERLASVFRKEV